jgi:hypothetical protein
VVLALRIGHLLAGLGQDVLAGLVCPQGLDVEFHRVVVVEIGAEIEPGDLVVLPPDVNESQAAGGIGNQLRWIKSAARLGGAAVVIKPSGAAHAEDLIAAGQEFGIAVLGIGRSVHWYRALAQISTSLGAFGLAASDSADGFLQDLFALAETTSMAAGGAVAIMDAYGQIVAYSSQPDQPIDSVRTDGILGRKVPPGFLRSHVEARHWKLGEVRRMESPGTLPRLAAPVRAGDIFLGSIWVIIPSAATLPDLEAILSAGARTAAVHLLRYASTASSSAWRVGEARVRARLLGRPSSHSTTPGTDGPCVVLAIVPLGEDVSEDIALQERLAALTFLVVSGWPRGGCTVLDDVVYGLLPLDNVRSEDDARTVAETIVRRSRESLDLAVAVGLSSRSADASEARNESLETARWIAKNGDGVGNFDEIRVRAMLNRAADALAASGILLPSVSAVTAYDRNHGTEFGRTILAYLENGLNVAAAASVLHLHPNTLRYRLRRASELFELALDDPDGRLAAWMFLRLSPAYTVPGQPDGRRD